ncbi:hypothetical protein ACQEUX_29350 [Micromonospora sp. CA-259024]|uniref:hypothetical protein n=1 Tax=Micromonospora sp. CA-259024 TaxID=3239965 RepID=UPI003D91B5DE
MGGIDGGGELDQLAGGAPGEPKPLPKPDGGGRGALGDRQAAGVHLAHQSKLNGGQPLRQHVRRIEGRQQLVIGEPPERGFGAVVDGTARLRQRSQHEDRIERLYDTLGSC